MKIESLHVGLRVRHPQYGLGTVKSIGETTAEIRFDDGVRPVAPEPAGLQPAEAQVMVNGLEQPLAALVQQIVEATVAALGLERPEAAPSELAVRWHKGRMVLHPSDAALQTKEIPLEALFHKIVMVRNNLRVLEQKINSHPKLAEAEKVEMQQYLTRCYGSLTTFNLLFRNKADQFAGTAAA